MLKCLWTGFPCVQEVAGAAGPPRRSLGNSPATSGRLDVLTTSYQCAETAGVVNKSQWEIKNWRVDQKNQNSASGCVGIAEFRQHHFRTEWRTASTYLN